MNAKFEEWINFQDSQPYPFYDSDANFDKWIISNLDFRKTFYFTKDNITNDFEYCFGKYTEFIISEPKIENLFIYIKYLLSLYDSLKGICRMVCGDPLPISLLRKSVDSKRIELTKSDIHMYMYPYEFIHAHTVSTFSLSHLITLFACDYIGKIFQTFDTIDIEKCRISKYNSTFTYFKNQGNAIVVYKRPFVKDDGKCSSWPPGIDFKCVKCLRYTENYYGNLNLCLDCYKTKYCYICGKKFYKIVTLPLCIDHS
jgi:hypothetical protein